MLPLRAAGRRGGGGGGGDRPKMAGGGWGRGTPAPPPAGPSGEVLETPAGVLCVAVGQAHPEVAAGGGGGSGKQRWACGGPTAADCGGMGCGGVVATLDHCLALDGPGWRRGSLRPCGRFAAGPVPAVILTRRRGREMGVEALGLCVQHGRQIAWQTHRQPATPRPPRSPRPHRDVTKSVPARPNGRPGTTPPQN